MKRKRKRGLRKMMPSQPQRTKLGFSRRRRGDSRRTMMMSTVHLVQAEPWLNVKRMIVQSNDVSVF